MSGSLMFLLRQKTDHSSDFEWCYNLGVRCFLALPLSEQTRSTLGELQSTLRAGRLVASCNLHVTIAFLDDRSEGALEDLHIELTALRSGAPDINLNGVGCFGGRSPRAIHVGVEPDIALANLHRSIRKMIRKAGIELPRRRFFPHVTIARLKPGDDHGVGPFVEQNAGFHYENGPVHQLILYRSILRQDGAEYHPLAHYHLD